MKIFVTYSNTPNCLEFGNKMHDKFLEQKDGAMNFSKKFLNGITI